MYNKNHLNQISIRVANFELNVKIERIKTIESQILKLRYKIVNKVDELQHITAT